MNNKISLSDKIYISGANGMVGQAIVRSLKRHGYGNKANEGDLLLPTRQELDLLDSQKVNNWFSKNSPTIVINAAAKVGGILANSTNPYQFIYENLKDTRKIVKITEHLRKSQKILRIIWIGQFHGLVPS